MAEHKGITVAVVVEKVSPHTLLLLIFNFIGMCHRRKKL
jgi:hypothetical protein